VSEIPLCKRADHRAESVAKILLKRGKISLTGIKISPHKHSQAGWHGCQDESSKILPQAILTTVKTTKLFLEAG
jgi:hypothetical protein